MLFLILIQTVFSLSNTSPFQTNFTLADKEYYSLTLDSYFAGDNLKYVLSPMKNAEIQNSSLSVVLKSSELSLEIIPTHTSLFQIIPSTEQTVNFFLYGTGYNISIYTLNYYSDIISLVTYKTFKEFQTNITQFQLINQDQESFVLILGKAVIELDGISAKGAVLFYIYINKTDNLPTFGEINSILIKEITFNYDPDSMYMAKGLITNFIVFTGYNRFTKEPTIFVCNITDISKAVLLEPITLNITNHNNSLSPMLAVTLNENHFIYLQQTHQLLKFEFLFENSLEVVNELYLDFLIGEYVTSMEFSNDYILLGTSYGFIVISIDFEEIYYKNLTVVDSTHLTSASVNSFTYNFVLIRNYLTNKLSLQMTNQNIGFYILGTIELDIREKNVAWGVFNYEENFSFFCTNGTQILVYELSMSAGYLNFTSDIETVNYSLKVFESNSENSLTQVFQVKRPYPEIGYLEILPNLSPIVTNFYGILSTFDISIANYLLGYNFYIESTNITMINQDFFECSANVLQVLSNFTDLNCSLSLDTLTNLIALEDRIIFYNKSTVLNYTFDQSFEFITVEFEIKTILQCGSGFIIHFSDKNQSFLMFTFTVTEITNEIIEVNQICHSLKCSLSYSVCMANDSLIIYEILGSNLTYLSTLDSSSFNTTVNFNDFCIYLDNFLGVIINKVLLQVYDLEIAKNPEHVIPDNYDEIKLNKSLIYTLSLPGNSSLVFASEDQLYIINENFDMTVFDLNMKYLKTIKLNRFGLINLWTDYIVMVDDSQLSVINGVSLVTSAYLAEKVIGSRKAFSIYEEDYNLFIYLLSDSQLSVVSMLDNRLSVDFECNITKPTLISDLQYAGVANIEVSNQFNSVVLSLPIVFNTNGQTIYVNEEASSLIKEALTNIDCSEETLVPLNALFAGQDLVLTVNGTYASVNSRFNFRNTRTINFSYDAVISMQAHDAFIATSDCTVFIIAFLTEYSTNYTFDLHNKQCKCKSISILSEIEILQFVVGCTYTETIFIGAETSQTSILPEYFLNFFEFSSGFALRKSFKMNYSPDRINTITRLDGVFLLIAVDIYDLMNTDSFYCNHLTYLVGNYLDKDLSIHSQHVNPSLMRVNYYYISDFEGLYDPMFDAFYIYCVDIYTGIIAIEFHDKKISNHNVIQVNGIAVSIVISDTKLYVAYRDTSIDIFYFRNWLDPVLSSSISPYLGSMYTISGSLRCSDYANAEYMLMLTSDIALENTFLHIVDLLGSPTSSVIADEMISSTSDQVFAEFINSTFIGTVTPVNYSVYELEQFNLLFSPGKKCSNGEIENILLNAVNRNELNETVEFTATFSKPFIQGNVNNRGVPTYAWYIIGFGVLFLIITSIIVFKKYNKKKNKCAEEITLFNYEFVDFN